MGVFKMSVGNYDQTRGSTPIVQGNPNPRHFEILQVQEVGRHAVAKIRYPDCANYEGMKILVFLDTNAKAIANADFIDPHFTDLDVLKPVARFEPTEIGWVMACDLLERFLYL